ncbi:MAG: arginine--tRNA ligase [Alkalinema sp. FL-bin-369]|nr:arginine--tRNA ligase [Leptolyngbyaceae cyanobacterium LF-bin-369]
MSIVAQITLRLQQALVAAFGEDFAGTDPMLAATNNPKFGDYQSNLALSLSKKLGQPPRQVAQAIVDQFESGDMFETPQLAGPGFINLRFKASYLSAQLQLRQNDDRLGIAPTENPQKIIVDFSSPNIAKEMHVGHLRSTIIGDCIARILEFQGHEVLRLNHVGDWGTQFGMLITYLREVAPAALTTADAIDLGDLVAFYKKAKARFDEDPEFQVTARNEVVNLQSGSPETLRAWNLLCEQSRKEFQIIYDVLNIQINERGESFYNPYLSAVVADLKVAGLLVEDHGAQCVFVDGFTNREGQPLPLIVQKSDGGFNYATTDLAALRYRITEDKAQRIIYVTDSGQSDHFAQVFQVAQKANWIPETVEITHVPFGLVQGEDGKKLKTRSGDTVRLRDLLDESVDRFGAILDARIAEEDRTELPEFKTNVATVAGLSAVKYADLSQNRTSNYVFSYDKMLADRGNTAPYLIYAYARVQSISRKGNIDFSTLTSTLQLREDAELMLAKHLLQLEEAIAAVGTELLPNRLCLYLFELSQKFNTFYDACPVLKAEGDVKESRLILCDLTARSLKLGLGLLGIQTLDRM